MRLWVGLGIKSRQLLRDSLQRTPGSVLSPADCSFLASIGQELSTSSSFPPPLQATATTAASTAAGLAAALASPSALGAAAQAPAAAAKLALPAGSTVCSPPSRSFWSFFQKPSNPDPPSPATEPCYWTQNAEPSSAGPAGPASSLPKLMASRVACMRGGQVVFRDLNMTLHEGGALLLTGPNGSGKSTFLRMMAGFIKPSAGHLMWHGHSLLNADVYDQYRTSIHLLWTKDAIKNQLTVDENVRFWAELEGSAHLVDDAIARVGLWGYRGEEAAVLSLGQRRRLQLARILSIPRSIWLLDEPSVGLDMEGVALLERMIDEHRSYGGVALVATHTPIKIDDCMNLMFPARTDVVY